MNKNRHVLQAGQATVDMKEQKRIAVVVHLLNSLKAGPSEAALPMHPDCDGQFTSCCSASAVDEVVFCFSLHFSSGYILFPSWLAMP